MSGFVAWGAGALLGSAALMALVLAVRAPVRGWVGPGMAYGLWALPALRMVLPPLPSGFLAHRAHVGMAILLSGPRGVMGPADPAGAVAFGPVIAAFWLVGALSVLGWTVVRHLRFCARLLGAGQQVGAIGRVRIVTTDVPGPLALGVIHRVIAVPRDFDRAFAPAERDLVLAHEHAHHMRGDLWANWLATVVLAAHWWNPCAWIAIRAFRQDQEFAVDARVLLAKGPAARPLYAHALAKAAGIGAPPACNLTTRSTLKGRLMMLAQQPRSNRRLTLGGMSLSILGGAALIATGAATAAQAGRQAVTIGVKPDGAGSFALIVAGKASAPGAPLAGGMVLPADFGRAGECSLARDAQPHAMVIKGMGTTTTYTVMCASAAPAPLRRTLAEGLASLKTMRASVAVQESPSFPPAERVHALGAIDVSIREMEATLAHAGAHAG